jgi:hypothetical protein
MIWVGLARENCGGSSWSSPAAAALLFESHQVNAASLSYEPVDNSDPLSYASFELGTANTQGRYRICYCPSYDSNSSSVSPNPCSKPEHFLQDAGIIQVYRSQESEYECLLGQPCGVTLRGAKLSGTDRLIVKKGGRELCGKTPPIHAWSPGGNMFVPIVDQISGLAGSASEQSFQLITYTDPGIYHMCFCPSYDEAADGVCNSRDEYYQVGGRLIVRGPKKKTLDCVSEMNCSATIVGASLSRDDRLRSLRNAIPNGQTRPLQ